jgi:hypothetical protein
MHKLTKIKTVDNPQAATASDYDKYRESLDSNDNHLSPNLEYWVIGEIIKKPEVGGFLVMDRWVRNGVLARGRFVTSEITSITEDGFETMNSVYKLEKTDDDSIFELTSPITHV